MPSLRRPRKVRTSSSRVGAQSSKARTEPRTVRTRSTSSAARALRTLRFLGLLLHFFLYGVADQLLELIERQGSGCRRRRLAGFLPDPVAEAPLRAFDRVRTAEFEEIRRRDAHQFRQLEEVPYAEVERAV